MDEQWMFMQLRQDFFDEVVTSLCAKLDERATALEKAGRLVEATECRDIGARIKNRKPIGEI